MRQAAEALKDAEPSGSRPLALGVTVLTSLSATDLKALGLERSVEDTVVRLAELSQRAGLDGVVASPREVALIRKACGKDFVVVTPGIRPRATAADDQKRTMTPAAAFEAGANYLVIGRPITAAPDPRAAAEDILSDLH
jgi:orotidine-5'-phosphate decarboxylase